MNQMHNTAQKTGLRRKWMAAVISGIGLMALAVPNVAHARDNNDWSDVYNSCTAMGGTVSGSIPTGTYRCTASGGTNITEDTIRNIVRDELSAVYNELGATDNELDGYVKYDDKNTKDTVTLNPDSADGATLTGVKDGQVDAASKDAVNGSQLYAVTEQVNSLDNRVTVNEGNIQNIIDGKLGLVQTDGTTTTVDKDGTSVTVDVTGKGGSRVVTGVADGKIAAGSSDAVNGSQLYAAMTESNGKTDKLGETAAANLGGGVSYDSNTGALSAPSYTVQNQTYNNVGSALDAVDGSLSSLDNRVTVNEGNIQNIIDGKLGLVQTDGTTTTVDKDGTSVTVDVTGKGGSRVVTGVADGKIAAGSSDAVNGSQLHTATADIATVLGGGASIDAAGRLTMPLYQVLGGQYNNIGAAFNAVHTGIGSLTDSIVNGTIGLVQQDPGSREITVGRDTDGKTVNIAGQSGDRVMTGVADGVNPNDAVNKSQLDNVSNAAGQRLNELDAKVDANRKSASQGIAAAVAMDIEYPAQHPGEWAGGAGIGHYDGETSVAVGMNYLSLSGKFKVSGAFGQSIGKGSKPAAKISFGFVF